MSMEEDLRRLSLKVGAQMRRMKTKEVFGKNIVTEEDISRLVREHTSEPKVLLWLIAYDKDKHRRRLAWNLLKEIIRQTYISSRNNGEYDILRWLQEVVSLAKDDASADEALALRVDIKRRIRH